ncbi:MAG: PilW family protein [Bacillota bacterium]
MNGKRAARDQTGHTLVEMMVALAVLVLVMASVASTLFFGEAASKTGIRWTDTTQQLRVAMKQVSEDFTYASSVMTSPEEFTIAVRQPLVTREGGFSDYDWSAASADWPGELREWPELQITYKLEGGILSRKVISAYSVHSVQTLAVGLDPNTFIRPSPLNPEIVQVRLSMQPEGVNHDAVVYGEFQAR